MRKLLNYTMSRHVSRALPSSAEYLVTDTNIDASKHGNHKKRPRSSCDSENEDDDDDDDNDNTETPSFTKKQDEKESTTGHKKKTRKIMVNEVKLYAGFKRRYEFPPKIPHTKETLMYIFELIIPRLLRECLYWPNIRSYVYAFIFCCKDVMNMYENVINRMLHMKMTDDYPHLIMSFPNLWDTGREGFSFDAIIRNRETWPGHWRTIGRIIDIPGLISMKKKRDSSRYNITEIELIDDIFGETNHAPSHLSWAKSHNITRSWWLFEIYIQIKTRICFKCGKRTYPSNIFFIQTDISAKPVYIACTDCIEENNMIKLKTSFDLVPYCVKPEHNNMFILRPYIEHVYNEITF